MTIECVNDFNTHTHAHTHTIQMRYDIYLSLDMFLSRLSSERAKRADVYRVVCTFLGSNK